MAVDMFLKLDGIKGEAGDATHGGEIHIESFSWGASQTGAHGTSTGGGAGKVNVHDISITKHVDTATPLLLEHCCTGKHIKEGLITVRKAGDKPLEYLKLKLADIIVSGQQFAGHGGGDLLTENVTLNFAKFYLDYFTQNPDGSGKPGGKMSWDIPKNAKP